MAREEMVFLVLHSRLIVHDCLIPSLRAVPQIIDAMLCFFPSPWKPTYRKKETFVKAQLTVSESGG